MDEDIIAIFMVFTTMMVGLVAFSPIGRAIADRLRHKDGQALPSEELDDVRAHLAGIQEQVNELAERQDFAERMLAQVREKSDKALPPAGTP